MDNEEIKQKVDKMSTMILEMILKEMPTESQGHVVGMLRAKMISHYENRAGEKAELNEKAQHELKTIKDSLIA